MNNLSISKSYLSISSPGTHLVPGNDTLARTLTRDCNIYGASLKKLHPNRFGYFAALPLPDISGSLQEIPQAIEEGCDGFVLMTNSHGRYLGDEELNPVFEELNRRKCLVFIHPTTPQCPCSSPSSSPEAIAAKGGGEVPVKATPFAGRMPNPMLEFFFDTARVVTNLFMSGTIQRCPDLKIILPHLGGAAPSLLSRWTGFSQLVPGPWEGMEEAKVVEVFRKQIWFDMAGFVFPSQIRGLMDGVGVPHTRLLYGSDFPFTQSDGVELLLGQMEKGVKELFNEEEIEDLYTRNAQRLLSSGEA